MKAIPCALALALLAACGPAARGNGSAAAKAAPREDSAGAVPERPEAAPILIRLRNMSDTLEMRSAFAVFPEDTVLFGDIAPRAYSEYHSVRKSYRYAYVRVQAGGREWVLQPVDYVGENLLGPGRYTWEIKPHDGPYPGFLDFDFLEDKARP